MQRGRSCPLHYKEDWRSPALVVDLHCKLSLRCCRKGKSRIVAKILSARPSVNNTSPQSNRASNRFSNWLEGDLLILSKPSFWLESLIEIGQPSRLAQGAVKALPVLGALLGTIAFWQWNAALMVALLMGTGGSFALFQLLQQKKQPWQTLQQWLSHPQAPLAMSVGSGLALLITTYAALAVWQDFQSPGLAMLLLTQAFGIFLVLGLAVWILLSRQTSAPTPGYSFDRCVAGLLQRDELRQLVAVRQLAMLATQKVLTAEQQAIAAEYLLLLSRKENDPIVSNAIQDSLKVLVPARPQLGDRSSVTDRVIQHSVQRKERVAVHSTLELLS
jgi:hypothetical protein